MTTTKELKKQIEKNVLECPYNKSKQDKEHECSDCDTDNDELKAELSGRTECLKDELKFLKHFEGWEDLKRNSLFIRYKERIAKIKEELK